MIFDPVFGTSLFGMGFSGQLYRLIFVRDYRKHALLCSKQVSLLAVLGRGFCEVVGSRSFFYSYTEGTIVFRRKMSSARETFLSSLRNLLQLFRCEMCQPRSHIRVYARIQLTLFIRIH